MSFEVTCLVLAAVTCVGWADVEDSFMSVMSSDKRAVGFDPETSELFNRTLASKDGVGGKYNSLFGRGARAPATPPSRVVPSYSPPSRAFITPPLHPGYTSPFADKPILRDTNSDSGGGGGGAAGPGAGNRRPIPPPPPFRLPAEDLIPIRPPDLGPRDAKKKTLNTPSFKKVPDASTYSEAPSTTTSNSRVNDTFDFVPILPYPSVSRILSGGSGRKHDGLQDILERARIEHDKEPRTIKQQDKVKTLLPPSTAVQEENNRQQQSGGGGGGGELSRPVEEQEQKPPHQSRDRNDERPKDPPPPTTPSMTPSDSPRLSEEAAKQEVTDDDDDDDSSGVESEAAPQPDRPEPRTRHVLGVAWDIHVYLIATLFAILACCSLVNIIRLTYFKHLLSRGYFLSVHGILLIIGCMRSFYLFYDAYNIDKSLPVPVSNLLMHMVFPLLTSAFAILFLFLLTAADVKAMNNRIQRVSFLAVFIVVYLAVSFGVHLYAKETPYSVLLPLICQCVFIILCVGLGLSYLYLYKSLSASCVQKASHMYSTEGERWSLAHAVRVTLATAMLSLLMAAVQLYGMLGDYEVLMKDRPQPWLWWGFQLSVRVIEISMCALLAWAGMQRDASALPQQPASVEDIYPAICTANQAYTMRSTKQHYDDTFPLNSLHHHQHRPHTTDRRSLKKQHPSLERRLQPSPSMLVAENGFVRFRTIADADLPDDTYATANSLHEFT